ncbi:peptidase M55 [Candidatus Poribacteria bacterium]|nr:peptidase M55 [Candidatus Poribacteria bacterium]
MLGLYQIAERKSIMKIYIITDLEGPAMISRFDQTRDVTPETKAISMKLLTWEVNAAVDGILDVDKDAEVIVWDGHGSGGIDPLEFHKKAKLIARGPIRPPYYLDETFDALFFVGQHAMAGTEAAPLCHTYSSKSIEYYKINGMFVGEFGARAIMAGTFGVPTVFISGDDKAVDEAKELVPGIYGAAVKEGLGRELAIHLSPKKAQKLIRKTASKACKNIKSIPPVKMDPPYGQEIRVLEGISIEGYLKDPRAEKIDERTVIIRSDNICDLRI